MENKHNEAIPAEEPVKIQLQIKVLENVKPIAAWKQIMAQFIILFEKR